jgi:hypothetical protein
MAQLRWGALAVALALLALGVFSLSADLSPGGGGGATPAPLRSLPGADHLVALALLGAPDGPATEEARLLLAAAHAGASFFVVGRQAMLHPGAVRALARPPFYTDNGGFLGLAHPTLEDLRRGAGVLLDLTGRRPRYAWAAGGRGLGLPVEGERVPLALPRLTAFAAQVRPGNILALPLTRAGVRVLAFLLPLLGARDLRPAALETVAAARTSQTAPRAR